MTTQEIAPVQLAAAPAVPARAVAPEWKLAGEWTRRPYPVAVDVTLHGKKVSLEISLALDGPLPRISTGETQSEFEDGVTRKVTKTLQDSDPYRRLIELRPQLLHAKATLQAAQATLAALEAKKAELVAMKPVPPDLARKLIGITDEIRKASRTADAPTAELETLQPLYAQAQRDLAAMAPKIGMEAAKEAREDLLRKVDASFAEILTPIQGTLTQLAQRCQERRSMVSVDGARVAAEAVAKLVQQG